MAKIIEQLEALINRTPTGDDRNLLTDINITLHTKKEGFTPEEEFIMGAIGEAWDKFNALPKTHPDEQRPYLNHIHGLQQLLAMRILRRDYPKMFFTMPEEGVVSREEYTSQAGYDAQHKSEKAVETETPEPMLFRAECPHCHTPISNPPTDKPFPCPKCGRVINYEAPFKVQE